jgi:hypothetical protein
MEVFTTMRGRKNPPLDLALVPEGAPVTFDTMSIAYLQDYQLQRYRSLTTARARVEHLRGFFGGMPAEAMTADRVRDYQLFRRKQRFETATINRETSALNFASRAEALSWTFNGEWPPAFPARFGDDQPSGPSCRTRHLGWRAVHSSRGAANQGCTFPSTRSDGRSVVHISNRASGMFDGIVLLVRRKQDSGE